MFLFCPFDRKAAVAARLCELGGEVLPIALVPDGVQSWAWRDPPTTALPWEALLATAASS